MQIRTLLRPLARNRYVLQAEARRGWIMHQTWHDLLFAHWPVSQEALRAVVPEPLELDLYGGQAWLGIVAFRLSGVRLRWLPEIPLVSHFPEINARTYVRYGDKRGVYFLSLDADNLLAIAIARPWFRLNYKLSQIIQLPHEGGIRFVSRRARALIPHFSATYHPTGASYSPLPGSLDHWLTERYTYFAVDHPRFAHARPWRCDVWHRPWQLRPAEAEIEANTLAESHGLTLLDEKPLLHYAEQMDARIWPVKRT